MTAKDKKSVDEAIERMVDETEEGLSAVKESLAKAHTAMDGARSSMQDAGGRTKGRPADVAERTRAYLEDAGRYLAESRDGIARLAARARQQAEILYAKAREQYEILSARARELYGRFKEKMAEVDLKEKGEKVLAYIRENPGKSILIALAVGFVVGYVSRPRD
jgi:ElaB/YqjD/DUF883 family membrane-anchored ribosome-binding protein